MPELSREGLGAVVPHLALCSFEERIARPRPPWRSIWAVSHSTSHSLHSLGEGLGWAAVVGWVMSLALRFLGVAGRDATHQAMGDTSMKPSTGQRRGCQQKVWSVAQDRADKASKKRFTCGPCSDMMGASEAHCLFCAVVRNWAGLESSFEEVNSGCRQSRQLEQDLGPRVQWCGSGPRLGPWRLLFL